MVWQAHFSPGLYFKVIEILIMLGLERVAAEEIEEKLKIPYELDRGRLFFHLDEDRMNEVSLAFLSFQI